MLVVQHALLAGTTERTIAGITLGDVVLACDCRHLFQLKRARARC